VEKSSAGGNLRLTVAPGGGAKADDGGVLVMTL
jgi:hypothetical protein